MNNLTIICVRMRCQTVICLVCLVEVVVALAKYYCQTSNLGRQKNQMMNCSPEPKPLDPNWCLVDLQLCRAAFAVAAAVVSQLQAVCLLASTEKIV